MSGEAQHISPAAITTRLRSSLALICLLGAGGCSSTADNWNGRIGSYTYSDMVSDYGAPLTTNQTAGSGTIAQWVVYRERRSGDYGHTAGEPHLRKAFHRRSGSIWRTDYLYEMTFDPAGRLTSWKKIDQ